MRIPFAGWVAPFGDPGINDRSHLPRAFRSVPRPSSPLSAKASTRCPYFALERRTQRQGPYPVQPKAAPRSKTDVAARQAKRYVSPKALELPPRSVLSSCGKLSLLMKTLRCGILPRHPPDRPFRACLAAGRSSRYGHTYSLLYDYQSAHVLAAQRDLQKQFPNSSPRHPARRQQPTGGVEVIGIEPTTPCLQSRCSPS